MKRYWDLSRDILKCLALIGAHADGRQQLQFIYDSASIYGSVDIDMLCANYAFFRNNGIVKPYKDGKKELSTSQVSDVLKSMHREVNAGSCEQLVRAYVPDADFLTLCSCCPLSASYRNMRRSDEITVISYILTKGGPLSVDLEALGVGTLCEHIYSFERIPYGNKPGLYFPFPLARNIAEYMIENAFACSDSVTFWKGFYLSRCKGAVVPYGKMDSSSLQYCKDFVTHLFEFDATRNVEQAIESICKPYNYAPPKIAAPVLSRPSERFENPMMGAKDTGKTIDDIVAGGLAEIDDLVQLDNKLPSQEVRTDEGNCDHSQNAVSDDKDVAALPSEAEPDIDFSEALSSAFDDVKGEELFNAPECSGNGTCCDNSDLMVSLFGGYLFDSSLSPVPGLADGAPAVEFPDVPGTAEIVESPSVPNYAPVSGLPDEEAAESFDAPSGADVVESPSAPDSAPLVDNVHDNDTSIFNLANDNPEPPCESVPLANPEADVVDDTCLLRRDFVTFTVGGSAECIPVLSSIEGDIVEVGNRSSESFLLFEKTIGPLKAVSADTVSHNGTVGIAVCAAGTVFFVRYDTDCYGILHTLFNSSAVAKLTSNIFHLAKYVYMYDRTFTSVYDLREMYAILGMDWNSEVCSKYGISVDDSFAFRVLKAMPEMFDNVYRSIKGNDDYTDQYSLFRGYTMAHVLSADASMYADRNVDMESSGFVYPDKVVSSGLSLTIRDIYIPGDCNLPDAYTRIVMLVCRRIVDSFYMAKYNAKLTSITESGFTVYVSSEYDMYGFMDIILMVVSSAIRRVTGIAPQYSCIPAFIK